jgi:alpha-L-fucosidase
VAKGGGLMVGVGPSAHGKFHPEAVRQLKESGRWLRVNGEAIYSTRPRDGTDYAEGDHVRFTRSKDRRWVYVIMTEWPGREIILTSLRPTNGSTITMLGSEAKIGWSTDAARGTIIRLPDNLQDPAHRPCEHAWILKVQVG